MKFNNVTDALRHWCEQRYSACLAECSEKNSCNTPASLGYRAADGLAFWLCSLTDAEFPDYDAYCSAVHSLLPVEITPPLGHEPNPVEQYTIRKFESAFLEILSSLQPDCPRPNIPYLRILAESEAFALKKRLQEKWLCRENAYWYPLSETVLSGEELFFISASILENYMDALNQVLQLPGRRMYCIRESWFQQPNCFETDELEGYQGSERFYAAKDFSWLIYFSHENSVSFAGSIVSAVKELLHDEEQHWNRMEDCW